MLSLLPDWPRSWQSRRSTCQQPRPQGLLPCTPCDDERHPVLTTVVGRPGPGRPVTTERKNQGSVYGERRTVPLSESVCDTSKRRPFMLLNPAKSMPRTLRLVETRTPASLHTWAAATSNGYSLLPNTLATAHAAR